MPARTSDVATPENTSVAPVAAVASARDRVRYRADPSLPAPERCPIARYASACHASACHADDTDWQHIAALYDALSRVAPSPVVEVNRAVALAMAFGPSAGLALADELVGVAELAQYHLLPSVRGDFLEKLGRYEEARGEFLRAASLTRNTREQAVLLARATACAEAMAEQT
jgi:predicted RNA polymerase sigma factor